MATGIQGSPGAGVSAPTPQNQAALDRPQVLPTNPTLSVLEANQEAMKKGEGKGGSSVFHSFPGSSFFAKDGTRFEFDAKGEMMPDNAEVVAELEKIADKPGSPIYQRNSKPTPAPGDDGPVKDIQAKAAATVAALRGLSK